MGRLDAIQALEQGKTVSHTYFSPKEWVRKEGHLYVFEDGCTCEPEQFWEDRDWLTGWSIVGDQSDG